MKNRALNLLFASLCVLSFSACADDKETATSEKVVEVAKETVSEATTTDTKEASDVAAEEKASTEAVATDTKKEEPTDKKQGDEEEPECD